MDALRSKLEAFQINAPAAALTFEKRLARENNWPLAYARRVIDEYKRFIYLIAIAGDEELSPSDQIDQAWHLHLTYTRSYWQQLCREILGFPLHHNPTMGGKVEQARFKRQYQHTLDRYQAVFGEVPPADIWPAVEKRFKAADRFIRVNRSEVWLLPRLTISAMRLATAVILPTILVACTEQKSDYGFLFWVKVVVGVFTVYYLLRFLAWLGGGRGGSGCAGSGCGGCGGCGG